MKLSKKAQAAMDSVIDRFKSGDLSPVVAVAKIARHNEDRIPSDKWSFNNLVLAFAQTGTLDCRGYKQWKQAGRQVERGSSAAFILAPMIIKKKDGNGEEESVCIGFRGIPVFPVQVTNGDALPEFDYAPTELPPLVDVAVKLGVAVEYVPLPPDRLGQCASDNDVKLGSDDVGVWFHELAHAAHNVTDGDRVGTTLYRESVAEFTATVLMELYGYGDRSGNCWQYIQHFSKDPLKAVMKAVKKVSEILSLLEVQ